MLELFANCKEKSCTQIKNKTWIEKIQNRGSMALQSWGPALRISHTRQAENEKEDVVLSSKEPCSYLVPKHNTTSAILQCFSAGSISFGGKASCRERERERERFLSEMCFEEIKKIIHWCHPISFPIF
jgi:hypothetical protein